VEKILGRLRDRDWIGSGLSGWPDLGSLFESRMPSLFGGRMPSLFESRMPSLFETRMPSVDVVDRDKEIVVKAEIPGMEIVVKAEIPGIDKDDLQVSVTDRTLTIKGESRHEEESEEGDMHRREIRRGSFHRTMTLPADVDGGKAKAEFKHGMLELHLPKARGAKKHSVKLG
jgi:HSP20 family protein